MIITDAGKAIFLEAMNRVGKDICHMFLTHHDEGEVGLSLALIDEKDADRIIEVNGLKINISEEDEKYLESATFDGEGTNLKVTMPMQGHGCGCGCHHHEGECCEGEDHECCCHEHKEGK